MPKQLQSFDAASDDGNGACDVPRIACDSPKQQERASKDCNCFGKLPVGKAIVDNTFYLGKARYSRGAYPSFFVQYCLDQGAIQKSDVTHIQKSRSSIAGNTFSRMTKRLLKLFPVLAKRMINPGIGAWGRRYSKVGKIAITDSFDVALGMIAEDKDISLTEVGHSFWFMRKESKELLYKGNVALREHIVCMGHIKLHKLEKLVCNADTEVIAYNTDSIKVIRPSPLFKAVDKALAKPGDACVEGKINLRGTIISEMTEKCLFTREGLVWYNLHPIEIRMRRPSLMGVGKPGFGKSYVAQKTHDDDVADGKKCEKIAWTKTAATNIGGVTLDHFWPRTEVRAAWITKGLAYDVLSFDEFTIIPERWWSVLLELKRRKPSLIFRFFGGPEQLHSKEYNGDPMWFYYHESRLMHYLVDGQRVQLTYQEATARYDKPMKIKLDSFEDTKTLAAFGNKRFFLPSECQFNIVKTPQKRTKVNEDWVKYLSKDKELIPCGDMNLWNGMYLISHTNRTAIVNSTRYLVTGFSQDFVSMIDGEGKIFSVPYSDIAASCRYGYADTVTRVISRSIDEPFNIWESTQMDWNEMFVALSRARSAEMIGMGYSAVKVYEKAVPPPVGGLIALKPALFAGFIYQRTDSRWIYIGSTKDYERREKEHLDHPVSKKVAAWEALKTDIRFEVIESYLCSSSTQLEKRENQLIMKLDPLICMNSKNNQKIALENNTTAITNCHIDFSRFKIVDDIKGKRFRINWRDTEGKLNSKNFSYVKNEKPEALLLAEAQRALLVKQYFI